MMHRNMRCPTAQRDRGDRFGRSGKDRSSATRTLPLRLAGSRSVQHAARAHTPAT